jgi:transcriptional regulator with XRE-family HTH domain
MTLQQIFIANLKKYRKKRGFSQMTLADLCGMGGNYIGQIEMGRRIPSFEKIEKIASVLEIACHELFISEIGRTKDEKRPEIKDYLQKMPSYVKKELTSRILAHIKTEVNSSLDPNNYL